MPWQPRTRQEVGRKTEKEVVKREGATAHPGSGSGRLRFDGSSDHLVVESKDAAKAFTLKATYLEELFSYATKQGKDAVICIKFGNGLYLRGEVTRWRQSS